MNQIRKGIRKIIHILGGKRILSPLLTAKMLHYIELGRWPNMRDPRDFNEKTMWNAFNGDTQDWPRLADKYEVRKFIEDKGLEKILIPLIGVYDNVEDIDFEGLPNQFVVKATNASSRLRMIYDKALIDNEQLKSIMKGWLSKPYGYQTGEVHYTKIKPRIIIEEMIERADGKFPVDYKFFCFDGQPYQCLVSLERTEADLKCKYYLMNLPEWEEESGAIKDGYRGSGNSMDKPSNLDEMIRIASELSIGFKSVRVDLYESGDKIYFGELTFTSFGFRAPCLSQKALNDLGSRMTI